MNDTPAHRQQVQDHEYRLRSLEDKSDQYVKQDIYDFRHTELMETDRRLEQKDQRQDTVIEKIVAERIKPLEDSKLVDAKRNLQILVTALLAVIGAVAASIIYAGLSRGPIP